MSRSQPLPNWDHEENPNHLKDDVAKKATEVRNGAAADLTVLKAAELRYKVKLKPVRHKGIKTIKSDDCEHYLYIKEHPNNGVGHCFYIDSQGNFVEAETNGIYDCFFHALKKILGCNGTEKTVEELRQEIADIMEENFESFGMPIHVENWVRRTYPDSANSLIFKIGLNVINGEVTLEKEDIEKLFETITRSREKIARYFGDLKVNICLIELT